MSKKNKKRKVFVGSDNSRNRQNFLLTFFNKESKYQEQEVNGFWLIKQFNGNTGNWQVHIYSKESYKNYKNLRQNLKLIK